MPATIQELLLLDSRTSHERIMEVFRRHCAAIKKKYGSVIAHISFRYIYGNSAAVFKSFTEANSIDCIFFPAHIHL